MRIFKAIILLFYFNLNFSIVLNNQDLILKGILLSEVFFSYLINNFNKNFFEKNKEIDLNIIVDKNLKYKMEFDIKYYLISKNESELIKNNKLKIEKLLLNKKFFFKFEKNDYKEKDIYKRLIFLKKTQNEKNKTLNITINDLKDIIKNKNKIKKYLLNKDNKNLFLNNSILEKIDEEILINIIENSNYLKNKINKIYENEGILIIYNYKIKTEYKKNNVEDSNFNNKNNENYNFEKCKCCKIKCDCLSSNCYNCLDKCLCKLNKDNESFEELYEKKYKYIFINFNKDYIKKIIKKFFLKYFENILINLNIEINKRENLNLKLNLFGLEIKDLINELIKTDNFLEDLDNSFSNYKEKKSLLSINNIKNNLNIKNYFIEKLIDKISNLILENFLISLLNEDFFKFNINKIVIFLVDECFIESSRNLFFNDEKIIKNIIFYFLVFSKTAINLEII